MTARTSRRIAGAIAVVCAVEYLVMLPLLAVSGELNNLTDVVPVALLAYPLMGAVIVFRQPCNTIGWVLVASGASIALGLFCSVGVVVTLDSDPSYGQQVGGWFANNLFLGGFNGLLIALAFLFPTGRTFSRRWRSAARAVTGLVVCTFVLFALRPGPLMGLFDESPQLVNPFGVSGIDSLVRHLAPAGPLVGVVVVLTGLLAMIARVRHSRGVERLQLQWFALAVGVVGVALVASALAGGAMSNNGYWLVDLTGAVFLTAGALGIPVAIGIALLRYRLYDIERIINRTLVYGALTASLFAAYLLMVLALGAVGREFAGYDSTVGVAVSTLAVAALVRPLRGHIQSAVDRRFYRRKYDATQTVAAFSARLRDEIDLPALEAELQMVVMETMQPAHVSLWLRPPS